MLAEVAALNAGISWSVCVRGRTGDVVAGLNPESALRTASVGKLLLLARLAVLLEEEGLGAGVELARSSVPVVADSGLWQHMHVESLGLEDIAVLIASVSDNHAANVLLNYIGLEEVKETGRSLGLKETALLDYVRDRRQPAHPPTLSTGSAGELSLLMSRIATGTLVSQAVSERMRRWLSLSADLSMVASAFNLDPLAHAHADGGFLVMNKTGTDSAVRADVGIVRGPARELSYAAIANWPGNRTELRGDALAGMHSIGRLLRSMTQEPANAGR